MATFYLKRGDTFPIIEIVCRNPDRSPCNLEGATKAELHVTLAGGLFARDMELPADRKTGAVRYTVLASDWEGGGGTPPLLSPGTYPMEVEILGGDVGRGTFPNDGNDRLVVTADLGDATP